MGFGTRRTASSALPKVASDPSASIRESVGFLQGPRVFARGFSPTVAGVVVAGHSAGTVTTPPSRGKRFLKLAGMTASVAGNLAKTKVKALFQSDEDAASSREEANRESGNLIAKTLGELKGAVMKVGQMASIAEDVLPKEIAEALGKLQREAPPMPFEVIAEQIERELGGPPTSLFRRFESEPFAAASIGQVHRAQTDDGRDVVVKVQYPGVEEAVDSDLAQLKVALRASGIVNVGREALNASFKEIRARLHEELDYCNEADNVRLFRAFHGPRHAFVTIPEVVGERSSKRVLTLTYEPGDPIGKLDELGYTQVERDRLGHHMWLMMCAQVFEFGLIHADPNPGNFAFRRDGTLVMYDFGCVKRLRPEIITAYHDVILAGLAKQWDAVDDGLLRLGVRRADGPRPENEFYERWRDAFAKPFEASEVVDYAKCTIHDDVVKLIPASVKRMASFQPATELIFLDRMVAGHYGNLRKLEARVPGLSLAMKFIEPWHGTFVAAPEPGTPA
jgi:predicted unusual protein kinase regulating ubiquinone biosynthesis (AarF/ABC1/UbiB family)